MAEKPPATRINAPVTKKEAFPAASHSRVPFNDLPAEAGRLLWA